MTEPIRGAGQPSWPLSPYNIHVSYGASSGIARGSGADWFGPLDPLRPGERFPMMQEIFYMP